MPYKNPEDRKRYVRKYYAQPKWKNYRKQYYIDNKEKLDENSRKYKEKNPEYWKRYDYVHQWVRRHKPKQEHCTICNEIKVTELANISGEYRKDIEDFMWLCRPCHRLYDNR